MRISLSIVLFLLVLALGAALPVLAVASEAGSGFVAWALDKSEELDIRWSRMTGIAATNAPADPDGTSVEAGRSSPSGAVVRGEPLSHDILSSHSLPHRAMTDSPLLPLSTRTRNGASRGVSRLQSPAQARLSVPHTMRRPLNSSIQQRNFFRSFGGSVSRPKLNSFGRINRAGFTHSRAATRPAARVARPRIL
jgi:hypothetical protein